MALRIFPAWAFVCLALAAQPLPKVTDYSEHQKLSGLEIGAKYLPRGLPGDAAVRAGNDFLVVDVGIFPETKSGVSVLKSQFTLRVNGKTVLAARSLVPGSSAAPVASRDTSQSSGSVDLGGPPITGHPGNKPELESMPRRPISLNPPSATGASTGKAALPEGLATKAVSGYLFFHFEGDPKAIHALELNYDGGGSGKTKIPIL